MCNALVRTPNSETDELQRATAALRARVAYNLRRLAKQRGLSIVRVCHFADVTRSAMYRALAGRASMTVGTIARLASALQVDPAELLAAVDGTGGAPE